MSVSTSITMYPGAVNTLKQAQLKAMAQTAEQILHEVISDAVIPFDTGNLQNVSTYIETKNFSKGIITIVHDAPYASRLYFHPEYNFQKTTNINAKGMWMEEWLTGYKIKRPTELFKQFLKYNSGGFIT